MPQTETGLRPLGQPAGHSPEGPIANGPYWPPVDDKGAPGLRQMGNPPEHHNDTFTIIRSHAEDIKAFDPLSYRAVVPNR